VAAAEEVSVNTEILPAGGGSPQAPTNRAVCNVAWTLAHGTAFERWRFWCPYGVWTCADGRQVLFNRDYLPIFERQPGELGRVADHAEWVAEIVATKHFFDGGNSPVSQFSVPARQWRPVVERINLLLVSWALPTARRRSASTRRTISAIFGAS
jgi:hypothetical protein